MMMVMMSIKVTLMLLLMGMRMGDDDRMKRWHFINFQIVPNISALHDLIQGEKNEKNTKLCVWPLIFLAASPPVHDLSCCNESFVRPMYRSSSEFLALFQPRVCGIDFNKQVQNRAK